MVLLIFTFLVVFVVGFVWGFGVQDMISQRRSFNLELPDSKPDGMVPKPPPVQPRSGYQPYYIGKPSYPPQEE